MTEKYQSPNARPDLLMRCNLLKCKIPSRARARTADRSIVNYSFLKFAVCQLQSGFEVLLSFDLNAVQDRFENVVHNCGNGNLPRGFRQGARHSVVVAKDSTTHLEPHFRMSSTASPWCVRVDTTNQADLLIFFHPTDGSHLRVYYSE